MSKINNTTIFHTEIDKILSSLNHKLIKGDVTKLNLLLLENIYIEYFGTKTSVKYLVKISRNNQNEVFLKPFDPKLLKTIYQAISDYKVNWQILILKDEICLKLPIITSAKKNEIVKEWNHEAEIAKVKVRKIRHDFLNYWKQEVKLTKEDLNQKQKEIQVIVDQANEKISHLLSNKIKELLKV